MTENNQGPTAQVHDSADHGGEEKENSHPVNIWRRAKTDPLAFFTLVLAGATAFVAVATVVLAGATIGLWRATVDLVRYAEKQAGDMENSLQISKDAADAMKEMASATRDMVRVSDNMMEINKQSLQVQTANRRDALNKERPSAAVFGVTVHNFGITSGLFDAPPEKIEARIQIRNVGPLEAKQVAGWAHVVIAPVGAKSFRRTGPNIVFSKESIQERLDAVGFAKPEKTISVEQAERVLAGRLAIYVYGEITYTDAGNSARYTTAFRYTFKGNKTPVGGDHILQLEKSDGGNSEK